MAPNSGDHSVLVLVDLTAAFNMTDNMISAFIKRMGWLNWFISYQFISYVTLGFMFRRL